MAAIEKINGTIKFTKQGQLVAEVSVRDSRNFRTGKTRIEVGGVTATVVNLGEVFKIASGGTRQYAYLANATGSVPAKPNFSIGQVFADEIPDAY